MIRLYTVMGIAFRWVMRFPKNPKLKVKVEITGDAESVMSDLARYRPVKANSLIYLSLKAKSAEGAWMENYDLPVINSVNTIPAKTAIDGLYRQARISKEQYDEAVKAIDALGPCANETGFSAGRYNKSSMVD